MKVMLSGALWQQRVPKGCCCTWGAGLSAGEGHQSLATGCHLGREPARVGSLELSHCEPSCSAGSSAQLRVSYCKYRSCGRDRLKEELSESHRGR